MKYFKWETLEYTKRDGTVPVDEFLESLNAKHEAKVLRSISLLTEFGIQLGKPHIDHLEDGIYELRTKFSTNIFRTMMFHWYGNKIVLLHGFVKKTQKTPKSEIDRAKKYRADFIARNGRS